MKLELDGRSSAHQLDGRSLENPDETTIQLALSKMRLGAVLRRDEVSYVETCAEQEGFSIEYQEDNTENHFKAAGNFSLARVTGVFIAFAKGDSSWKESFEWRKVPPEREEEEDAKASQLGWGIFLVLAGGVLVARRAGFIANLDPELFVGCGLLAWGIASLYKFFRKR